MGVYMNISGNNCKKLITKKMKPLRIKELKRPNLRNYYLEKEM